MLLRALSLNAWGLPFGLARSTGARMRALAKRLPDFEADVIGFQEVWQAEWRDVLIAAGHRAGYRGIWYRSARYGGSGLLVLSRLPILSSRFVRYRLGGLPQRIQHADYYGGKGFVLLELQSEEGPLALLDTHLHASYVRRGEFDEYLGVRASQAVQLAAALRQVELPLIALGDFNMEEGDPDYDVLFGLSGLVDSAAALDRRQPTCTAPHPYRAPDDAPYRIDLVLSRSGRDRVAKPRTLQRVLDEPIEIAGETGAYSDHAGLLAEIEVESVTHAAAAAEGSSVRPDPQLVERAAELLLAGRELALARQRGERRWAGGAALASLCGLAAAGPAGRSRRSFLSSLLLAVPALGLPAGAAMALLSEVFVPNELRGYDEISALLEAWR